jgi:surface polysaccharide O-acyltransferase-like enzyme
MDAQKDASPQPNTNLAGAPPAERAVRLAWVDVIRAGGAFLVVLAHVVLYPSMRGAGSLWAQSAYYTATRVAVPLFFMASGFLLLGREEAYSDFFRKRALRVFIPFVLWSFVYIAWSGGFDGKSFSLATIGEALLRILRGPRASHLWFFYVLISLYLFTPVLRIFTRNAQGRDLLYFCALWFLLDPALTLIRHLTGIQVGFEFLFVTGYIGYYVLGYYLGHIQEAKSLTIAAIAIIVLTFAFVFVTVYLGQQAPDYDQFYEGYLSVPVVLMTAASMMIIRGRKGLAAPGFLRWVLPLSKASLGIYLAHVIVLDLMDSYLAPAATFLRTGTSILAMPLTGLVAFLLCFAAVWLLQKIPLVRYAVP